MLCWIPSLFAYPICLLFSIFPLCLLHHWYSGSFPSAQKSVLIILIGEDKKHLSQSTCPTNYHPIFLLPCTEKLPERRFDPAVSISLFLFPLNSIPIWLVHLGQNCSDFRWKFQVLVFLAAACTWPWSPRSECPGLSPCCLHVSHGQVHPTPWALTPLLYSDGSDAPQHAHRHHLKFLMPSPGASFSALITFQHPM